jgi:hypothetical protein
MRKLSILIILTCFLYSCSDDSDIKNSTNSLNFTIKNNTCSVYDSIASLDDTDDQLLVASALSPNEKMNLWQCKLDHFKNTNTLSTNQLDFINKLELKLSNEEIFIENSKTRADFISTEKTALMNEAQTLFGQNEGWYLLTKVENITHRVAKLPYTIEPMPGGGTIKACGCQKDSDCVRLTGISIWGVSWQYGTCPAGGCYVQTYFFGIWESDNIGRCKY